MGYKDSTRKGDFVVPMSARMDWLHRRCLGLGIVVWVKGKLATRVAESSYGQSHEERSGEDGNGGGGDCAQEEEEYLW